MRHSKRLAIAILCLAGVTLQLSAQAPQPAGASGAGGRGAGGRGGRGGGGGRGGAVAASGRPVDIAQSRTMDQASIDRGQKLFAANCASCHGENARGGSKTKTDVDLIRSPMVLDDLGTGGKEIGDYLKYGRPEKNMPKFNLTDAESSDIAMWLHRQIAAAAERGTYQRLNVFSGDAKAGEAFFNGSVGKCNTCHSATGDMKGLAARNNNDSPHHPGSDSFGRRRRERRRARWQGRRCSGRRHSIAKRGYRDRHFEIGRGHQRLPLFH